MDFNINNMKKIITLALLLGATALVKGQNNLVFNKVLLVTLSSSEDTTVPADKAWKVTGGNRTTYSYIKVDGEFWNISGTQNNYWLPEGTNIRRHNSASVHQISVLEFNIVPISSSGGGSGVGDPGSGI